MRNVNRQERTLYGNKKIDEQIFRYQISREFSVICVRRHETKDQQHFTIFSQEMYLTMHTERPRYTERPNEATSHLSDTFLYANSYSIERNGVKSRCLKLTNTKGITMESPLSHSHEEILVNFLSSFSSDVDGFPCKEIRFHGANICIVVVDLMQYSVSPCDVLKEEVTSSWRFQFTLWCFFALSISTFHSCFFLVFQQQSWNVTSSLVS